MCLNINLVGFFFLLEQLLLRVLVSRETGKH